jgi:hypothetical protein
MSASSTRLPTPEGPSSVSGAPQLPAGFTDTFTSRYVDIGELRQHAVTGGDGPPLLLVHGWSQTSSTSTKSARATTSRPGRSRTSSRPRCEPRSGTALIAPPPTTQVVMSNTVETANEIRPFQVDMSSTVETANEIRPFQVDIPEEELAELRRRIAVARWPSRELVADRSQGVQLATM